MNRWRAAVHADRRAAAAVLQPACTVRLVALLHAEPWEGRVGEFARAGGRKGMGCLWR
jgi:hypothetical protein